MSWQATQLKYAFGLSGILSFYGIVSFLVLYTPDKYFGGDSALKYKIILIACVLLTLPIALVGMFVASRRKKKDAANPQEAANTDNSAAAPQKLTTPTGNYGELTQSAEETVQFLKNSNVGNGKDPVYALPWYIVAGTPKSGKTSLSLASGLHFQNLPSQRQSEQKHIRPTKNIDWRVTSDAVFLDTAGRYQTEGADGDEWAAMLETVKKYRGARPIDGMIVPISAERILHADDTEIEQMAKVLRTRIDEAMQRTKIRFPIYLVFTHADAIEGFRDSFSTSQKEGENLVWGATIPIEQSQNAHALFDPEYDLLQNSVMKRRLMRLSAPFPPARQLKIFNFPLHFGSARKKLGHFVSTLFRPNPFSESPFLRGFYFTAVPVNRPQVKGGQTMTNMAQTVGQSYFTQKLYRDVILRDKDLVATMQAQKVKPPIMGWLLTALGALLVLFLLGWATVSLYLNKQLVDETTARGEILLAMVKADRDRAVLEKNPEETRQEIDKTEALRQSLEKLDTYEREGAPLSMRMGFYSGSRIYHEAALPRYISVIEQRYKKPVVRKLEEDLDKFAKGTLPAPAAKDNKQPTEEDTLGRGYDLLKAYLMLSGKYRSNAEPTFLATTLEDYWKTESKVPDEVKLVAQKQLEFYAKQVDRDEFPRIELNEKLVDDARLKLQKLPAYVRYYKRVTTDISKNVEPVSVGSVLNGRTENVFESAVSVPGAYTIDGYRKYMKDAIAKAQDELTKDDWVMGEKADKAQAQGTDIQRLQDKYFNDYTDNWRKFVRGVNIPTYKNPDDAKNSFRELSKTESPMKILLEEISRQTNLSAEPKSNSWLDSIWSLFQTKQTSETGGTTAVEKDFRPLFGFTASEKADQQSQLAQYGTDLKKLSEQLETMNQTKVDQIIAESANPKSTNSFIKAMDSVEKAVNSKIDGLKTTPSGQEIADLLKKPVNNLKDFFGAGVQKQIENAWTNEILPKAKEVEKGFPYDADGETDLTKLTAYLKPKSGTLSKFYDGRLKQYFEESNGQLKVKDGSEVQFNPEFVKYLNNAFRLRQALFGDSETPQFAYEFRLQKVADAVIEVTIDGQKTDSNGTGSAAWKFPAQSGETGAIMKFASTAEPAPAANPTAPAATSSSTTERQFAGSWGLFKFVDAGSPKKQPDGSYALSYSLGGKTVAASVKPSGGDLFDRSMFTSARAPEKLK
jgi:type VI secretion system protein ImpL